MSMLAITREVSPNLDRCELTYLAREKIDTGLAIAQHRQYQQCLVELGCRLFTLPGDPELPDCVFVEDVAVVLDEVAIITRPGVASRHPEIAAVRAALEPFRPLRHIREPGLLDGGDVLSVGRTVYVGRSRRTNRAGIEQLDRLLKPHGYWVQPIEFNSCLHLKSAVTRVAEQTLLVQPEWVSPKLFAGLETIAVDSAEPHGANALWVMDTVVYPSGFERTRKRLEASGLEVRTVDQSELAKAEGGVTCCSLIFDGQPRASQSWRSSASS